MHNKYRTIIQTLPAAHEIYGKRLAFKQYVRNIVIGFQYTMAKITFRFEDSSIPEKQLSLEGVDKSILEITEEYDIHLNHNCGGVCACSTCHIYVQKGSAFLEEISDKEEDFIDRAINPKLESRLACQCIILDENAEIEVEIPDQRRIIGHEH